MPGYLGFVLAINEIVESDYALEIEVYFNNLHTTELPRIKKLYVKEILDNKSLILVSILRDALVHSLPIKIIYEPNEDKRGIIDSVEVRTKSSVPERWLPSSRGTYVNKKICKISIISEEFGPTNISRDGLVEVGIRDCARGAQEDETLLLVLNRQNNDAQKNQFELLKYAYERDLLVSIGYHEEAGSVYPHLLMSLRVGSEVQFRKYIDRVTIEKGEENGVVREGNY
jgi:hypothetical protein